MFLKSPPKKEKAQFMLENCADLLNENFVKNSKEGKKFATSIVRDYSRHDFANLMDDGL